MRLCRDGDDLDDLVSAGTVGLIEAIDRFDARRARLSTFCSRPVAWKIRSYQRRFRTVVSRPTNRQPKFGRQWDAAERVGGLPVSLGHFGDESPDDRLVREEELARLRTAIATLPPRLKAIIRRRLDRCTLKAIGRELGISRERVRQLHDRAVEILTKYVREEERTIRD